MILFNDTQTIPGITIADALAYVGDVGISNNRVTMGCQVTLSLQSAEPDYAAYTSPWKFLGIPYDDTLDTSPSAQCYEYLMGLPEFENGSIYPVPS